MKKNISQVGGLRPSPPSMWQEVTSIVLVKGSGLGFTEASLLIPEASCKNFKSLVLEFPALNFHFPKPSQGGAEGL